MSKNHDEDFGRQIEDTVRSAVESGDLAQLKNIGPVVQNAVRKNLNKASGQNAHPYVDNTRPYPSEDRTYPPPPPQQPRRAQQPPVYYQQGQRGRQGAPRPAQNLQQTPARAPWQGNAAAPWQGKMMVRGNLPKSGYGVPSVVFGVMGMVGFGIASIVLGVATAAVGGVALMGSAISTFLGFALSGGLLGGGLGKRSLTQRLRRYISLFGERDVVTIEELSRVTGRAPKAITKDIRRALDKRLVRDIRMDAQETCLIRGGEAYQLYIETEQARQQRAAEEAELQKRLQDPELAPIEVFKAEGQSVIRKIHEANDAIPGEEISLKLDKLENTTSRIVSYVEKHPEKLPDTRKFMNYYLPTTLKLVEKYRQYDAMDIHMENVQQAKTDIEKTLDTINVAFNNLLGSLYHEDTLDVATDIDVLKTMLAQEGLTGTQFEIDTED